MSSEDKLKERDAAADRQARIGNAGNKTVRTIFGIFMICVYVGMGILFLTGFFGWETGVWGVLRWVVGIVLIAYGIWRGYRQFAGIDRYIGDED